MMIIFGSHMTTFEVRSICWGSVEVSSLESNPKPGYVCQNPRSHGSVLNAKKTDQTQELTFPNSGENENKWKTTLFLSYDKNN